jgi:hypothetical protein
MNRLSKKMILVVLLFALWHPDAGVSANTRTLEFPFALSADPRSEFSASFPVLSAGQIRVEAVWRQPTASSLRLALIRPDGSEAKDAEGDTPLMLHYRATEQEVDSFQARRPGKWLMKVSNNSTTHPEEVSGRLRITIPASSRVLIETQFSVRPDCPRPHRRRDRLAD